MQWFGQLRARGALICDRLLVGFGLKEAYCTLFQVQTLIIDQLMTNFLYTDNSWSYVVISI